MIGVNFMAKKEKIKKTPKEKAKKAGKILLIILLVIALIAAAFAVVNAVIVKSERSFVDKVKTVSYESQLVPEADADGNYTFTADRDFKIIQLTDVHIGSGFMSGKKDTMALNAVAAMVTAEKPDLVVVTGDVAYPVPFQSGTFNNKPGAVTFAELMENLGVYWCVVFGNHDTEAYSYFSREDIGKLYSDKEKYPHCLFSMGDEAVDGVGNYIINVKTSAGKITQSLFMFDSHSYTDNDYFGIMWKYDAIHKNQIEWYKKSLEKLTAENKGETPKSLAFFHIPPLEMRDAYYEYRDAGFKDTENVKYIYGKANEPGDVVVYSSAKNNGLIDAFLESKSTQGVFFGHDHVNNISLDYKGLKLTYGYSVDYLAYSGIYKFGLQRGCTVINTKPDGSVEYHGENYYQDKYSPVQEKESVELKTEWGADSDGALNPFANDGEEQE